MKSKKIGRVYAGRHGIVGALTEDLIDVYKESRATIKASTMTVRPRRILALAFLLLGGAAYMLVTDILYTD